MDWTITVDGGVLIEVLWYRQTHEDREAKYELCPEAVQVAELEKAKTT